MKTIEIGAHPLDRAAYDQVIHHAAQVKLAASAESRILDSQGYLKQSIAKPDAVIYGVNTGFGKFSDVRIADDKLAELQLNILRSHACGIGEPLSDAHVRGMLLLRAASLAQGHSGVSMATVEQLIALLNSGIFPIVPSQGSVGASGDLAPLAHLALVLVGEGEARVDGRRMAGGEALRIKKLKAIVLGPKEGLALINGTQLMTAVGMDTINSAHLLARQATLAAALSVEGLRGTTAAFYEGIHALRPHPGQVKVARDLLALLAPSGPSAIATSHEDCDRVQDPYSLRCVPQVHGACFDAITFSTAVLEREMNSVTDNPLVFSGANKIVSGGNFHGEPVAMALDFLAIALAELGSISLERINRLVNPEFSRLPAFLVKDGGLQSGLMILQVAAASLVSENKTLCHPAVVDSISTSNDKEDHVSMGPWAAMKGERVAANVRRILAMELIASTQAIDFLRPLTTSAPLEAAYSKIRKIVPPIDRDRSLSSEIEQLALSLARGEI